MSRLPGIGIAIAAVLVVQPSVGWAQAPPADNLQAPLPSLSGLSVSVAAGPMQSQGRQVTMGVAAVQIALRRHLLIEPEVARWVEADAPGFQSPHGTTVFATRRRAVTIAGANVLFRAGTRRVVGLVGGGAGFHVIRDRFDNPVNPTTGAPIGGAAVLTSETRLGLQGLGGVDVVLSPRWRAFAVVRGEIRPELNVGVSAGARFVLRDDSERLSEQTDRAMPTTASTRPGAAEPGRTVEVVRRDGQRVTGRLLALSTEDVTISARSGDLRVRLTDVRRVQRPAHWARNLALAGAAVFGGLAIGYCTAGSCGSEGLAMLAIEGAIATGGGFAIGAMINAATARNRTIYP